MEKKTFWVLAIVATTLLMLFYNHWLSFSGSRIAYPLVAGILCGWMAVLVWQTEYEEVRLTNAQMNALLVKKKCTTLLMWILILTGVCCILWSIVEAGDRYLVRFLQDYYQRSAK